MLKTIAIVGAVSVFAAPVFAQGSIECTILNVDGVPQTTSTIVYDDGKTSTVISTAVAYEMPEGAIAEITLHATGAVICDVSSDGSVG